LFFVIYICVKEFSYISRPNFFIFEKDFYFLFD